MTAQLRLTADEAAICRGFSCPHEPLDASFLETLAGEYGRSFAKRFVRHSRGIVRRGSPSLLDFLEQALERPLSFETAWHPSFGQMRRAIVERNPPPALSHAVHLGVRLAEQGHVGHWAAELPAATQLQFARWLLPPIDRIHMASRFREVALHGSGPQGSLEARFFLRGNQWQLAEKITPAPEELPFVHSWRGKSCFLLLAPPDDLVERGTAPLEHQSSQRALLLLQDAFTIVKEYAAPYLPWIGRVLRRLVPVRSESGKICSGSYQDAPGVIYFSVDCPAVAIAEILVHEASHQYYFLLARYGSLLNGPDRPYFSPIRETKRPLSMILLAYHAFANVMLFYRLCQRNGLGDNDYCRANEAQLASQLALLQDTLSRSKALSPLGQALWQPVAARL